jgi:hypothetical protein
MFASVVASTVAWFRRPARIALAASALMAAPVIAQAAPPSALVPAHHWIFGALRRVESVSPGRTRDAGASTLSHAEVITRLRLAAESRNPVAARLATDYLDRFLEELPVTDSRPHIYGQSAAAGFAHATGRAGPGDGFVEGPEWTGARPLPDQSTAVGKILVAGTLGPTGFQFAAAFDQEETRLDETHGLLRLGPLDIWGGRRAVALGPASGLVLSGRAPFNAGGFQMAAPITLPWILRYVGPFHFETFASRMERNGRREKPWFWAARGSVQPASFLTLGVNRAVLFGGVGHPLRLKDVAAMVVGAYGGDGGNFENQVVSVDGRLKITGSQPLDLYIEWGADDSSGMWFHSPGITMGVRLPTLPGVSNAFAGAEYTMLAAKRPCCNTHWYNNAFFGGSWAKDDVTLGHPLGGQGREGAVDLGVDAAGARLRTHVRLFARNRGAGNIYAPERLGDSRGFTGEVMGRAGRMELRIDGSMEDGAGWRESTFQASLRVNF